jgi:putative peptidoglycan lipid II flippase
MRRVGTATDTPAETSAARDSATVGAWTLVSRFTGLLRVLTIGAVLGPTYFANTFQTGYLLPNLIYSLIAGQILAMVVVPSLVRALVAGGEERARAVVARIGGVLIMVSAALAILLALASPLLAWTLTFGIPDDATRARAHNLTIVIILFAAPQVVLYAVAALNTAAQQARRRFVIASAAPAAENIGVIGTMVVAAAVFGTGADVADVPIGLVMVLGIGTTTSVGLHAALQIYGARRAGVAAWPTMRWRTDPDVVETVTRLRRSVRVAACQAGSMYTVLALAATVPGGVFVLQVAYQVHNTAIAIGTQAVSTAVLPRLSASAHRGDLVGFVANWRKGLSYAAIAGLPIMVLIAVFASPAADVLTRGEANDEVVVTQLALCLTVIAAAQLVGGMHNLGRQGLFARLDIHGPRLAAVVELVVTVLVGLMALALFPAGTSRLVTLAVAILAGEAAGAAVVLLRLRAQLVPERFFDARALASTSIAAAAMLPVAVVGLWLIDAVGSGGVAGVGLLGASGLAAVAVFAVTLRAAVPFRTEVAA